MQPKVGRVCVHVISFAPHKVHFSLCKRCSALANQVLSSSTSLSLRLYRTSSTVPQAVHDDAMKPELMRTKKKKTQDMYCIGIDFLK